jgi:hypothetical protein
MFHRRYFGPPPHPVVLRALGLEFPPPVVRDGVGFSAHTLRTLADWGSRRHDALSRFDQRAGEPSVPGWWGPAVRHVLEEGYRAGLRVWLDRVVGADVIVATPADLAGWCQAQALAVRLSQEACTVFPFASPRAVYDALLLGGFVLITYGADALPPALRRECAALLSAVEVFPPWDDAGIEEEYWIQKAEADVTPYPFPYSLRRQECKELVRLAWRHALGVSFAAGREPPRNPPTWGVPTRASRRYSTSNGGAGV